MNLPWKKSNIQTSLHSEKGAALVIVLFFSIFALITITIYFLHQMNLTRISMAAPVSLQALLNARSGVYKAFYFIQDSTRNEPDTLHTADSRKDTLFGGSLFSRKDEIKVSAQELTFDTVPHELDIYSTDSFGKTSVAYVPWGGCCIISSTGEYRGKVRTVTALLGSTVPAFPDTVAIIANTYAWGESPHMEMKVDTAGSGKRQEFKRFNTLLAFYNQQLSLIEDSSLIQEPLTIQSNQDLGNIPATIKGPLLLDGGFSDLNWHSDRLITVLGDLQVTGTVHLEDLRFIVGGEVKLYDKSDCRKVSIYTPRRVFIGDNSRIEKCDILAGSAITVYGKAEILDKSTLVSAGVIPPGKPSPDTTSKKFSIIFGESSIFDGVAIALGSPASIKTDPDVVLRGVLWAKNNVCHEGSMKGLIRAGLFTDCSAIVAKAGGKGGTQPSPTVNSMKGKLKPLEIIGEYTMPFFMDPMKIVSWSER